MSKLSAFIKTHKFFFLFLLLNVISFWKLLILPHQLAYGDLSPFHLSVSQALEKFFYIWEDVGFGYSRSPGTLFPLIQALLLLVFRTPLIAQKIYLFSLPIISFLTFNYLLKSLKITKNGFAKFVASTLYAYAPVAFGEFLGGTAYSTMLGFAFFPALYANTFKLVEKFDVRTLVINGLFLGILASVYAQLLVIYGISLIIPFLVSLSRDWRRSVIGWARVAVLGLIALAFNPILYLGSFNLVASQTSSGALSTFSSNADFFFSNIDVTYAKSSIPTTLRLGNIASFSYDTEHIWTVPFFLVVLFVLSITVYSVLYKDTRNKFVLISLLSYLTVGTFIVLTKYEATYFIFSKLPILFMFRNPSKLTYLSTIFFGIMLANSLSLAPKLRTFAKFAKYVPIVVLVLTLIYIWPVFLGDRGLKRSGRNFVLIPEYSQIVERIESLRQGDGRTVWLPMTHEHTFIKLQWLDPTKFHQQIGINQFGERAYEGNLVDAFIKTMAQNDFVAASNVLKAVQVDFVVILKNEDFYLEKDYSYNSLRGLFSSLEPVEETDFYVLYQLDAAPATVYAPDVIVTSNVSDGNQNLAFSRLNPSEASVALSISDASTAKLNPTDNFLFVTPLQTGIPTENVFWIPEWTWDTPPEPPTKVEKTSETEDFRSYILRLLVSNGEIAKYLSANPDLSNVQRKQLTSLYQTNQQSINQILDKLFEDDIYQDFIDLTPAWYMYGDRAHGVLYDSQLLNDDIVYEYEYFASRINQFYDNVCDSQYCYAFHLNKGRYVFDVYDVGPNEDDGVFAINGSNYGIAGESLVSPTWRTLGAVDIETGPVDVETDLNSLAIPHTFDEKGNRILADKSEDIFTYEVSFLHSFGENIELDLYLKDEARAEYDERDLVIEKTFAGAYSNNFCQVVLDKRCYRSFSVLLTIDNSVENIMVHFDKDVSSDLNAKNHIRDIQVTKDYFPVLSVDDQLSSPRTAPVVNYEKVSPVKYEVTVSEIVDDFLLVFNKTFNPDWILVSETLGRAPEEVHLLSNYFANGWYVSKANIDGADTMHFTIEFKRQELLRYSLISTLVTSVVGVGVVVFFTIKERRKA